VAPTRGPLPIKVAAEARRTLIKVVAAADAAVVRKVSLERSADA
jgi:hypothetical protein